MIVATLPELVPGTSFPAAGNWNSALGFRAYAPKMCPEVVLSKPKALSVLGYIAFGYYQYYYKVILLNIIEISQ